MNPTSRTYLPMCRTTQRPFCLSGARLGAVLAQIGAFTLSFACTDTDRHSDPANNTSMGGLTSVSGGVSSHVGGSPVTTVEAGGSGGLSTATTAASGGRPCIEPLVLKADGLFSDETLLGHDTRAELDTYSFSQSSPPSIDPQLYEMGATVSIRTTNQWGTVGTKTTDYSVDAIQALKDQGSRVILGLTASVVFESQFSSQAEFLSVVTRDAENRPVPHSEIVPNAYRGNLAHPKFRDLVVANAKTLVDVGADGIFFDEANAGYSGAKYDSNEGFDDYHEADFRRYLCAKHPDWTTISFSSMFDVPPGNTLDCSAKACLSSGFSVRKYLANKGFSESPAKAAPALIAEWGRTTTNRLSSEPKSFTEAYDLVYWADIVRRVRNYARDTYHREILITSNGLFPFVDFQSVGLYPWNPDATDGSTVQYVPTTAEGRLNAGVSLLEVFGRLRTRSEALAGHVPVVLFIDWPTTMLDAYFAFTTQEKRDYFRLYGAEAYASGLRFAWHLRTSIAGNPTAEQSKMLPWFVSEAAFYRNNAALYVNARPTTSTVSLAATNVATAVTELSDGSHAVHLINHAYQGGFVNQDLLQVTLGFATTAATATVISPDIATPTNVTLQTDNGRTSFVLPTLASYSVVVIR